MTIDADAHDASPVTLTTSCCLDELGLVVTGQRVEPVGRPTLPEK